MHKQIENLTIEQMREIVDGAPDWAIWWCVEKKKFLDFIPCSKCLVIEDLRTAIAKHDSPEFKVGDLVVIKANPFWPEDYLIQKVEPEHIGKWYMNAWRHATPEEKEAGHRLDDTTDHVTDIRNHLSPSTIVTDLHVNETDKLNRLG